MKNSLLVTAIGSVLAALGFIAAPQSLASPAGLAQRECDCSNLKVLQIELRNASRLRQAFSNKIAELRTMNGDSAQVALKIFAEREARHGLETIPDYKGPSEFDYSPWGENQRTFNFPTEKLCGMSDSAKVKFDQALAASACDGIGAALRAHEEVHANMCRSIGYRAYLGMHGADRAQEEVEAYDAQSAVLRAEIAKVLKKNCKPYRASGQDGPTSYSGVVCSLERPFTITGNNPLVPYQLKFVPSSGTTGTLSYSATYQSLTMTGSGTYTVEGADTDKPRILAQTKSTLTAMGHSSSGGGPAHIDLTPLDTDECAKKP